MVLAQNEHIQILTKGIPGLVCVVPLSLSYTVVLSPFLLLFFTDTNTGAGFEIFTLTNSASLPCETARLGAGEFLGRCRGAEADQLVVSARLGGLHICEVAVISEWLFRISSSVTY